MFKRNGNIENYSHIIRNTLYKQLQIETVGIGIRGMQAVARDEILITNGFIVNHNHSSCLGIRMLKFYEELDNVKRQITGTL